MGRRALTLARARGLPGVEVETGRDLGRLSTMRLRSVGDLATVRSVGALKALLPLLGGGGVPWRVLGAGSNMVLPERGGPLLVRLDLPFDREAVLGGPPRDEYDLPASVPLALLTAHALRHGLAGWEAFTGIPATLGGAVAMNAGTSLGETGPLVREALVVGPDGRERTARTGPGSFAYRSSPFLGPGEVVASARVAHFGTDPSVPGTIRRYLAKRRRTQPLDKATCGCVLKNLGPSCRAGALVDTMGLKGLRLGDAAVSRKHANFLENRGGATAGDVKALVHVVRKELARNFGLDFEPEAVL